MPTWHKNISTLNNRGMNRMMYALFWRQTCASRVQQARHWSGCEGPILDKIINYMTFVILPCIGRHSIRSCTVLYFAVMHGFDNNYQLVVRDIPDNPQDRPNIRRISSYWNIVLFYWYYINGTFRFVVFIIFTFAVFQFIPLHLIYNTRTVVFNAVFFSDP